MADASPDPVREIGPKVAAGVGAGMGLLALGKVLARRR
jgi:hypothetical protein